MLNKQHIKLLDLLKEADSLNGDKLATSLNVSTRQVRKYITTINNTYNNLILSSHRGYQLNQEVYKENEINEEESIASFSPGQRRDYLIQVILADKTTNIFDLADECFVSISTIESDLQNLKKRLAKNKLNIQIKQNKVSILGDEIDKRKLMNTILSKNGVGRFNFTHEVQTLIDYYHFDEIATDIRNILISHNIYANDYALNAIVLHVVIMVDRFKNDKELPANHSRVELKTTVAYEIATEINALIKKSFNIQVSESETLQLTLVIDNNTSTIDYSIINADNIADYIAPETIDIARTLTQVIEKKFYIDSLDDNFFVKFAIHIHNLMNRINAKHTTKNPFKHQLKNQNPFIYDIAVYMAHKLQKLYKITINEDEISYFAIHVGGHLQLMTEKDSKLKAIFVYTDYYNLHSSMIQEIDNTFNSTLTITNVVPLSQYDNNNQADLILMTDSFMKSDRHVYVGHFLTPRIIDDIHSAISSTQQQRKKEQFISIAHKFFNEDLFSIEQNSEYRRYEIIEWITNRTTKKHYTSPNFINDIIDRERLSNTNFNTVAIPHSLSANVEKSFIYTYLSPQPLQWGEASVNLVLLVGVSAHDINDFSILFDTLVEMLIKPANIAILLESTNYQTFMDNLLSLYT